MPLSFLGPTLATRPVYFWAAQHPHKACARLRRLASTSVSAAASGGSAAAAQSSSVGLAMSAPLEIPALRSVGNFRDVASADPGRVREHCVYRCACPVEANEDDAAAIGHVRTLIDLRSDVERQYQHGRDSAFLKLFRAPGRSARRWVKVPLLSKIGVALGVFLRTSMLEKLRMLFLLLTLRVRRVESILRRKLDDGGLPLVNEILLRSTKPQIRRIVEIVADPDAHPVAIFCTAGKDRTGFVVAMLLAALGTPPERIVQDFTRSAEFYRDHPAQKQKQLALLEKAKLTPERWIGSPPAVIERVLEVIRRDYGSMDAFLTSAGVHEDTRARLRNTMLVDPGRLI